MADRAGITLKLRFLLLLGLMLAAQNLALIHDFAHSAAADSSPCLVCTIGSNVETAAADFGGQLSTIPAPAAVPALTDSFRFDSFAVVPVARAPPSFL